MPGTYTVKLSVDGAAQTRTFQLKMDPRVGVSQAALRAQFTLAERIVQAMGMSYSKMNHATANKDTAGAQRYSGDNDQLASLLDVVESADAAPTPQTIAAVEALVRDVYATK